MVQLYFFVLPTPAALLVAGTSLIGPWPAEVTGYLAAAEKGLDKASEKWLREFHLLVLPEEEAVFRGLQTAEERKEFQRIFWRGAIRTRPLPGMNRMEEALREGPSRRRPLTSPTSGGSKRAAARSFLLLGDPLEVQGTEARAIQGRGAREKFRLAPADARRRASARGLDLPQQAGGRGGLHGRRAADRVRRRLPLPGAAGSSTTCASWRARASSGPGSNYQKSAEGRLVPSTRC